MPELSIVVVGSVNLDIVARVERFPLPGETLTDAALSRFSGGKGANQALAARRLGARVSMVACVGDDPGADEALATLGSEGVDLKNCRTIEGVSTGTALILVSAEGENQIVVAPGANAAFLPDLLELPACDAVIAQLEIPMATVLRVAQQTKGFFCLNAAPAKAVPVKRQPTTGCLMQEYRSSPDSSTAPDCCSIPTIRIPRYSGPLEICLTLI
jgi:ribokinase